MTDVALTTQSLATLMPFHLLTRRDGTMVSVGPTLARLYPDLKPGSEMLSHLHIRRPIRADQFADVLTRLGSRLTLAPVGSRGRSLRAVAVACDEDLILFDVSLGSATASWVQEFDLTEQDFSPADPSVELFYLAQTQGALLNAAKELNARLEASKTKAERMANTDMLTELPNRRALTAFLEEHAVRARSPMAVIHIDLDRFKEVNDTLGHAAGDQVLAHAARVLQSETRDTDIVSRIGGDEFVLVLIGQTSRDTVEAVAARLIERISTPIPFGDQTCSVGASVGTTFAAAGEEQDPNRLLIDADLALYAAKRAGRGRHRFFEPAMRAQFEAANQLGQEIEAGLTSGQFVPHFQPKFDMARGALSGFEALARWHHPTRGLLPPSEFLFVADQSGFVEKIDNAIVTEVLATMSDWHRRGLAIPRVSINVTAGRISQEGFLDELLWQVDQHDLRPEQIGIEVLESVLIDETSSVLVSRINRLSDAGFSLELDDFGTGHASISNLRKLKLDTLKIDRSFVSGIDTEDQSCKITRAMITLANSLGITPLAEGVETQGELDMLRKLGCNQVQGYFLAKPMPRVEAEAWLEAFDPNLLLAS